MYWNLVALVPYFFGGGLIETWDVLKWHFPFRGRYSKDRLIETWDVLKWINEAMKNSFNLGLIETWDVLK